MSLENGFSGVEHLLPTSKEREDFLAKWEDKILFPAVITQNAKRYKLAEEIVEDISRETYASLLEDETRDENWLLKELHDRLARESERQN